MIPVYLATVRTRDGVSLDGIVVPPKQKGSYALLWVHGLASRFSSGQKLIEELSKKTKGNKILYLKFNTRGHDIISRDGKKFIGAAFETFADSVKDIRALIGLSKELGYKKIILAGHSTGANKVLHYIYKTKDPSVKGLILAGAVSDIAAWNINGKKHMKRGIDIAKKLKKKNRHSLMPNEFGFYTAERYVSLYEPGHAEDVFPYLSPKQSWKELKSMRLPIAVIMGAKDKYLDRRPEKHIDLFRKNAARVKSFSGISIRGADHSFHKCEKELARAIATWINKEVLKK